MLDIVRFKLEGALTSAGTFEGLKKSVRDLLDEIYAYLDTNKQKADLMGTFRIIEEYDTLFRNEVGKFIGMPQNAHYDRIYQIQEILSICSLLLSYLTSALKKYNTEPTETRGSTARALRQLQEAKEHYKSEKMSWGGVLKSETTMIDVKMEELRINNSWELREEPAPLQITEQ